jgi:hypothetical protein
MQRTIYKINDQKFGVMKMASKQKVLLMAAICLSGASTLASALPGDSSKIKTVDSVYEWGVWQLGIEPAAGGPIPVSTQALNVRLANVKFRPNDNSAFSPTSRAAEKLPITLPPLSFPDGGIKPTTVPFDLPK